MGCLSDLIAVRASIRILGVIRVGVQVLMMEHSGADGDPPLNGYEPNVQTEGPDVNGVAGNGTSNDNPGSSDSEDKITEYMRNYVLTVVDRDKLTTCSLQWVDKAISGLRQKCSESCIGI